MPKLRSLLPAVGKKRKRESESAKVGTLVVYFESLLVTIVKLASKEYTVQPKTATVIYRIRYV